MESKQMQILSGKQKTPWAIILYGVPGIGKSVLGAMAPNPLVMDLEGGVARINVDKTPRIETWDEFMDAVKFVAPSTKYKTVVIDTISALEILMTKKILDDDGGEKTSLADFGYQRGYKLLGSYYALAAKIVDRLKANGKNVILIGHESIEKVENPSGENFGRFTVQSHREGTQYLVNSADAVLLNKFEIFIKPKEEKDFSGKSKKQAAGKGQRLLFCQERPHLVAKNRFRLPESLKVPDFETSWQEYADFCDKFYKGFEA